MTTSGAFGGAANQPVQAKPAKTRDELRALYVHFTEHHALQGIIPQAWDAIFSLGEPGYDTPDFIKMEVPDKQARSYKQVTLSTPAGDQFTVKPVKGSRIEIMRHKGGESVADFFDTTDPDVDAHIVTMIETWARSKCPSSQIPQLNVSLNDMKAYVREGIQERRELAAEAAASAPNPRP